MRALACVLLGFSCAVSVACTQPCKCEGDVCTNCSGTTPTAPLPEAGDSATADSGGEATAEIPDAGSCRATIDTFCASDAGICLGCRCVPDWSTAKSPSQWCSPSTGSDRVFVYPQCDGFNLVVVGYADTSTFYYYDPLTLKLVRVENHGNGGALCVAGQAGSVVPLTDCFDSASPTSICASDAAAE